MFIFGLLLGLAVYAVAANFTLVSQAIAAEIAAWRLKR